MKKFTFILCNLLALNLLPALSQEPPQFPKRPSFVPVATDQPKLATFDLDFPGGTPAQLVEAIEKATGKPLNVIIPTDGADTQLPPLKMNDVNVAQLFQALEKASLKEVRYVSSTIYFAAGPQQQYSTFESYYSFTTEANPPMDNSIWYFHADKPPQPPAVPTKEVCKFYQLQPYLDHGFTVDDITTAIQTGWKMAGITSPPELNYHKETNLLIACGNVDDLDTIQKVLDTLPKTSIDKSQLTYFYKEAGKVKDLELLIHQLSERVDDLTTKLAHSTEKNSGK